MSLLLNGYCSSGSWEGSTSVAGDRNSWYHSEIIWRLQEGFSTLMCCREAKKNISTDTRCCSPLAHLTMVIVLYGLKVIGERSWNTFSSEQLNVTASQSLSFWANSSLGESPQSSKLNIVFHSTKEMGFGERGQLLTLNKFQAQSFWIVWVRPSP